MFDKMVEMVGNTPFAQDDLKIAGYLLFKKLAATVIYNPNKKIKAPVTLIKATETFLNLEKDYGLSNVRDLFFLCSLLIKLLQYFQYCFLCG